MSVLNCLARGLIGAAWLALPPTVAAFATPAPSSGQTITPKTATPVFHVQTAAEALVQDAREYAVQNGVALDEAMRRLGAQEESVKFTDRLQETYRDRLAGISIEHHPVYRIVVLLTGSEPVAEQTISAGGMNVPVVFRTGAPATREQLLAAISQHQAEIRSVLPGEQGMGVDPRTGEIVLMVRARDAEFYDADQIEAEAEDRMGVAVRVRVLGERDVNLAVDGGSRLEGFEPRDGRRYVCTTGFVVTDSLRTGIVTAAHCPDALTYREPGGDIVLLVLVGTWGARYQDVQVHVGGEPQRPLFLVDSGKSLARTVTSWRNRTSTRAGDFVCHRGETSGYSCAQVELVDYAPPGDLCGGPCDPVWVTVSGPNCRGGDSGGPIFHGGIAFGIVKGASYSRGGRCNFYYYMSVDYLPENWSLLREGMSALNATALPGGGPEEVPLSRLPASAAPADQHGS